MRILKTNFLVCAVAISAIVILGGCQNVDDWLASRQNTIPIENNALELENNKEASMLVVDEAIKTETKYNNIFFLSKKYDPETKDCETVYWVHISNDTTKEPIQRNLNLLLAGPTDKWQQAGYFSVIPAGTKLNSSMIRDNVAYLEFSPELNNLAGSCAVIAARAQITATAKAAAKEYLGLELERVVITTTGGDSETTLQP